MVLCSEQVSRSPFLKASFQVWKLDLDWRSYWVGIYIFLILNLVCWIFIVAWRLFLARASGSYSLVGVCRFLTVLASRCRAQALGVQALVAAAHRLSNCGVLALVAPCHVGSSLARDQTCVPLWLIHVEVWQKTKFCKAIILQLKNKYINEKGGKKTCVPCIVRQILIHSVSR